MKHTLKIIESDYMNGVRERTVTRIIDLVKSPETSDDSEPDSSSDISYVEPDLANTTKLKYLGFHFIINKNGTNVLLMGSTEAEMFLNTIEFVEDCEESDLHQTPDYKLFVDEETNEIVIVMREIGEWVIRVSRSKSDPAIQVRNFWAIRNGTLVNLSKYIPRG